ncbi:MAG: HAD family phosphatase [bacterium]
MKRIKQRPKAVLFDMDGVIVDSMPYHYLAWYEALRPLGVRVNVFEVYLREGERWDKSLKDFLAHAGMRPSKRRLAKIFKLRQKIFRYYFKRRIFEGAEVFLRCLKNNGYTLGLVTGTPMIEVKKILPPKIKGLFTAIVSGEMVKLGKPHPAPYLKAAQLLKLKPRECLVVENAPLGIRSAKAAGMFCIAVTTSLPREYLKNADIVVNRLEEITGVIEKSCKD